MQVRKIKVTDFRKFNDDTLYLGKRITCISGYNAVGKSTLLGMLANATEYIKRDGETIDAAPFKVDLKDIIKFHPDFDPTISEVCTLYFNDIPANSEYAQEITFRSTWQDDNTRYRIIPKKTTTRNTEKKIKWPTLYLGLSRLYPIGEVTDEEITTKKYSPEDFAFLSSNHKFILSSSEDYNESVSLKVQNTKKNGFGIVTDEYDALSNSAGQDNVGQILKALLSFKKLKERMGAEWIGGQLLIDEIDATLHPAAQNKLIDFLYDFCGENKIQIVFTTHSLSLIEHIHTKYIKEVAQQTALRSETFTNFELVYISNGTGQTIINRNPDIEKIKQDLLNQYQGGVSNIIKIYSEDAEARWMFDKIFTYLKSKEYIINNPVEINHINVSLGHMQLLKLLIEDYPYFSKGIILLDGDVEESTINEEINHKIPLRFQEGQKNRVILKLPGGTNPEKILWDYANTIAESHNFYSFTGDFDFNKRSFTDHGPFSPMYDSLTKDREKYKKWFKDNKYYLNSLIVYWIEDNIDDVLKYLDQLKSVYDFSLKQNSYPGMLYIQKNGQH